MRRVLLALVICGLFLALNRPGLAEKTLIRPTGTTRYREMVAQLEGLARFDSATGSRRMALASAGRSVRGRALWLITLHDPAVEPKSTQRVFYLCRQHGHEPAGTEAALQFIRQLVMAAPNSEQAKWLKSVTVYVVPMANPDGAEAFLRHNAHDVDMNRDWIERREPETRALYHAIVEIKPDVLVDQHEMYPDDPRGDLTEAATIGSGASPGVVAACQGLQEYVLAAMLRDGHVLTSHWVDDLHPARLAHRYWPVRQGIPAILLESARHAGSGRTVAERAALHLAFMNCVLAYSAEGRRDTAPITPGAQ